MQQSKWKSFLDSLSLTKKILLGFCIAAVAVSVAVNFVLLYRLMDKPEEETDVAKAEDRLQELKASKDNELYTDLVPILSDYITDSGYISDTWSFAVIDVETGDMATYNSHPMCSASIIKQYIMGAVFEDYDKILDYYSEDDVQYYLKGMITQSDNDCANALIAICGYGDVDKGIERINAFCEKYGYTQTRLDHQFYTETDPDQDNMTSAADNASYQYDILQGRFEHSEDMLDLLKASNITHKIPAGIPDNDVVTANKTGDLDTVENDCAIVWADNGTYILSIMTCGLYNSSYTRVMIRQISAMTYEYFEGLDRGNGTETEENTADDAESADAADASAVQTAG